MLKIGDKFEHVFVVDAAIHQGFIALFKDTNPLHTDQTFATAKGFRGKVMHGNILNGFLSYFVGECLPSKDVIIHRQTIKYRKPVYLDDRLMLSADVREIYESVGAVVINFVFENQEKNKVALGEIQIGTI